MDPTTPAVQLGLETVSGEHEPVFRDPKRAARGLPPWRTADGERSFTDDQVDQRDVFTMIAALDRHTERFADILRAAGFPVGEVAVNERLSPGDGEDVVLDVFLERVLTEDGYARLRAMSRPDTRIRIAGLGGDVERTAERIADYAVEHIPAGLSFAVCVHTVVDTHGQGYELPVDDLAAAIIHGRVLTTEHGIMTWADEDGKVHVPAGGLRVTYPADRKLAADLVAARNRIADLVAARERAPRAVAAMPHEQGKAWLQAPLDRLPTHRSSPGHDGFTDNVVALPGLKAELDARRSEPVPDNVPARGLTEAEVEAAVVIAHQARRSELALKIREADLITEQRYGWPEVMLGEAQPGVQYELVRWVLHTDSVTGDDGDVLELYLFVTAYDNGDEHLVLTEYDMRRPEIREAVQAVVNRDATPPSVHSELWLNTALPTSDSRRDPVLLHYGLLRWAEAVLALRTADPRPLPPPVQGSRRRPN